MVKNFVKRRGWLGFSAGCVILIVFGITLWWLNLPQPYSSLTSDTLRDGHTVLRIMSPGIWSNVGSFQRRKGDASFDVYPAEQGLRFWIDFLRFRGLPDPPAGFEESHISIDCRYEPQGQELDRSVTEILNRADEANVNTVKRTLWCPLGPAVQVDTSHPKDPNIHTTESRTAYIFAGADSGAPNYVIYVSCDATPRTKREMFDAVDYIVSHLKFVDVKSQAD